MLLINEKKYFSQWRNGPTFALNTGDYTKQLTGSVGEKVKMVADIYSTQVTEGTEQEPYSIEANVNGVYNLIKRIKGSWIADGFLPGDTITEVAYYDGTDHSNGLAATPFKTFSATVATVSDLQMTFTAPSVVGGGPISAHAGRRPNNAIIGEKIPVYLSMKFGLVENSDTSGNTVSPFSTDQQGFYYSTINPTPTTHDMLPLGGINANQNWNGGSATVKFESSDDPMALGVNYRHRFTITHIFVISPFYLEDYETNLEDRTQPENLAGTKSLKHIVEYEFRTVANNSNTDIVGRDDLNKGNVGWFGENYNGGSSIYTASVTEYEDTATAATVTSLQSKAKTTVKGEILGSGFSNTDKAGFYFFHGAILDQYSAKQGTLQETFLLDNIISTMVAGTKTDTGTGRIKRFKLDFVSATKLTFEADIELTTDQADYVADGNYFIGVQIGNTAADETSNKTIIQLDWQPWTVDPDVVGLCTFKNQGFLLHNQDASESGYKNYKGWIEDGALFKSTIVMNKSLEANLKSLKFKLIAYKTADESYFELQRFNFNLKDVINTTASPREQKVDIETTRNFKLATGDQFNEVTATFNTISGTTQDINITCGFKFDWQSWNKNKDADTIFVDQNEPSNGLGNDASRYSLSNGYEIRCRLEAEVDQWDATAQTFTPGSTIYTDESPALHIYNYDEDAGTPAQWSCLVETFDSLGTNLGGAILTGEDTKMKITWTPLSGSTSGFSNTWAIHRIETLKAVGYGDIDELSTIRESRIGNLLKPLSGQTYLKSTNTGTTIVTECLIDNTRIKGSDYKLSGRLGLLKIYGRYGYAGDFKFLNAGKTEAISFNYIGFPGESNSLRLCTLDSNYNVVAEQAIDIDNAWDWTNMRFAVDLDEVTNGKAVFYAAYVGNSNDLGVSRFVYNGTTYIETQIYSLAVATNSAVTIKIDPALRPNSRAFLWLGMVNMPGNSMKTLYYNGATYTATSLNLYDGGINNTMSTPSDVAFHNGKIYFYNYDSSVGIVAQQVQGKIGIWTQTGGSTTDATDRSTFANYTWSYDAYRNATSHQNVDGIGTAGDWDGVWGMDILEIDSNNNPVFIGRGYATGGGRHLVRIRANIASPTTSAHWTIETPCAAINGIGTGSSALSGTASASTYTNAPKYSNGQNLAVIDANNIICGSTDYNWIKWTINSWTGASANTYYINAPFDVNYTHTSGNILTT